MQTTVTYRGQLLTINLPLQDSYGRGATATVLRGTVVTGAGMQYFALKVYPMFPTPGELELLNREIDVWQKFNHSRILPFIGRCELGSNQVALVSPFMKNGNMCEYLRQNPAEDRVKLVIQVAEGLQYLHSKVRVVHGDIKGENVLISDEGTILLADFGLSTLVEATTSPTATHIRQRKTIRFSAPELFLDLASSEANPAEGQVHILRSKTTFSDVFAFGMLIFQIYADKPPWFGLNDLQVINSILNGNSPPRPTEGDIGRRFCNATWAFCEKCWSFVPANRPTITDALAVLERLRQTSSRSLGLNPHATEFRMAATRTAVLECSTASRPLNALAAPFSPRAPMTPTQLTPNLLRSALNSNAAVFVPRAKPAAGATPARASGLDPHAMPFVPSSVSLPTKYQDEDLPAQRPRSPAQVADICASPSPAIPLPLPDRPEEESSPDPDATKRSQLPNQPTAVCVSPSPTASTALVSPPDAPLRQPTLNHNATVFVPRLAPPTPSKLNREAAIFVPRRAIPPPLLCTSLASSTSPPLVDSPRTPDLVPDLPSSAPPTPSTAHPTPTRGDSAVFNLDAKPFVPGQRLRSATTPAPAQDDKQETIRAMAYALLF